MLAPTGVQEFPMRTPTPQDVNTIRGVTTWALRLASLVLVAYGAFLVLQRVAFAVGIANAETAFRTWEGTGEGHSLYRGLAMLIVGAALGAASSRLSRWAIPVLPLGCPACGYESDASPAARCPECGSLRPHG
jgi:hypothetical protein